MNPLFKIFGAKTHCITLFVKFAVDILHNSISIRFTINTTCDKVLH